MSVIGFDIGNESCVIAAAKRGGIDVLLNDEAKRETPSVVSFGDKQRFLGSAGAAFATSNPKSTISQIKRLIGRLYKEPSVQEDLKMLPFVTGEGPRGGILIEIEYLNKKWIFTPVEILGMLITHLKQIAEKNLGSPVVDCVIGIPSYFTDLQRREYLDAARVAGLTPLRLIHDGTAIALGYGMYKTDFAKSGPTVVVFVDIGHCDTQVTVAAFAEGGMKILSHSFDLNLGGRNFDEVLFRHFAAQFEEKYKINVYSNPRACIRLRAACEKVKKVLSANAEAPISIECLIDDTDVRGVIKREQFEKLSEELLNRVNIPCIQAVENSGVSVDKICTIELVGSGSRIPAITKVLTSLFKKEPTRTLNASECVARGCALRCAMLSPAVQVRKYQVYDIYPYSIALPLDEAKNNSHKEYVLFPKGGQMPSDRMMRHNGSTNFFFKVVYNNTMDFPAGVSPIVGHFQIGLPEDSGAETLRAEFNVRLNDHGIVEVESASALEVKPYAPRNLGSLMGMFVGNSRPLNLKFSENFDVATTKEELHEAQVREQLLAEQDKKVEENKDQRNTLESFVYDTRSKLSNAYGSFATESEKKVITERLQETEDWLYEDSDDESEQDYTGKLDGLKKLLDPIENKYKYETAKLQGTKALQNRIAEYRTLAESLPLKQKQQFNEECILVQQHVNDSAPSNGDEWPNFIKETLDIFAGRCKVVFSSKPSYSKHDKGVDPNQGEKHMHLNQREKHAEPNQKDKRADPNQKDHSADLNQKDKRGDLNKKGHSADLHQRAKLVDNRIEKHVEPKQRDNRMEPNKRDNRMELNQRDKHMNLNQREKDVQQNQREKDLDPNQREKHVHLSQREKHVHPNQKVQPSVNPNSNQMNQRAVPNQMSESGDAEKTGQLVDLEVGPN